MDNQTHDSTLDAAMLERARRILELTHRDWRLDERPSRKSGKATRPRHKPAHYRHHGYTLTAERRYDHPTFA